VVEAWSESKPTVVEIPDNSAINASDLTAILHVHEPLRSNDRHAIGPLEFAVLSVMSE
jgi:hypothetical protein